MKLSTKQIAHLRGLAHNLNPVVMIGNNGLTENVIKEIELNLNAHELIKARIRQSSFRLAATGGKVIPSKSCSPPGYWLNVMLGRDYDYALECCQSFAGLTQALLVHICREAEKL